MSFVTALEIPQTSEEQKHRALNLTYRKQKKNFHVVFVAFFVITVQHLKKHKVDNPASASRIKHQSDQFLQRLEEKLEDRDVGPKHGSSYSQLQQSPRAIFVQQIICVCFWCFCSLCIGHYFVKIMLYFSQVLFYIFF